MNLVIIDVKRKEHAEVILTDWGITVAQVLSFEEWVGTSRSKHEIVEFCKAETIRSDLDLCVYTGVSIHAVMCNEILAKENSDYSPKSLHLRRLFNQLWLPEILRFLATTHLTVNNASVVNLRSRDTASLTPRPIPESIFSEVQDDITDFLVEGVYGTDHPVNIALQVNGKYAFVPHRNWVKWPGLVVADANYGHRLYAGQEMIPGRFIPAVDLSPLLCIRPMDLGYYVVRKEILPVMMSHIIGIPYMYSAEELVDLFKITIPHTSKGGWTYSRSSQNCSYPDPANPESYLDIFCYAQTDDEGNLNPLDLTGEHIALCNPDNMETLLDHITKLEARVAELEPKQKQAGNLLIVKADSIKHANDHLDAFGYGVDNYLTPATAESFITDFMSDDELIALRASKPYTAMPWLHVLRKELLAMSRVCVLVVEPDYKIDNFAIQAADCVIDLTQVPYAIIKQRGIPSE